MTKGDLRNLQRNSEVAESSRTAAESLKHQGSCHGGPGSGVNDRVVGLSWRSLVNIYI